MKKKNVRNVNCMRFYTRTEAGSVHKNSTSLEFLKAAAGNNFVIEREYKKRSKAGYKRCQSHIMHISRKFHLTFFLFFWYRFGKLHMLSLHCT